MTHELSSKQRNIVVFIMMIGTFIAVLNQTLLTTALPAIMKSFRLDINKFSKVDSSPSPVC
ncbi:hypothetical protein [Macrococcus bovicus]|uniref:MFS transporter n=1 Tax=Macrococcus bovicus TaxID=69968 RepID=A0A4R6BW02_9STAP|nr:hypothetical protein [Macrococcus bovicus]TDM12467.1 hypothetical protein ERX55_10700 [Macrococcus bovicus]